MGSEDQDDKLKFDRKIILVAVSSVFVVMLIIVSLHLYLRYLREERRRRDTSNREMALFAPDVFNHIVSSNNQPPKVGIVPLVIASLPMFPYKYPHQNGLGKGEAIECSICLNSIVEDVMVKVLPNCKHMFHVECIDMWLGSNSTCPICRTMVEGGVQSDQMQPSAPPLEATESRFSSFRWIVNRDRSSRIQNYGDDQV